MAVWIYGYWIYDDIQANMFNVMSEQQIRISFSWISYLHISSFLQQPRNIVLFKPPPTTITSTTTTTHPSFYSTPGRSSPYPDILHTCWTLNGLFGIWSAPPLFRIFKGLAGLNFFPSCGEVHGLWSGSPRSICVVLSVP